MRNNNSNTSSSRSPIEVSISMFNLGQDDSQELEAARIERIAKQVSDQVRWRFDVNSSYPGNMIINPLSDDAEKTNLENLLIELSGIREDTQKLAVLSKLNYVIDAQQQAESSDLDSRLNQLISQQNINLAKCALPSVVACGIGGLGLVAGGASYVYAPDAFAIGWPASGAVGASSFASVPLCWIGSAICYHSYRSLEAGRSNLVELNQTQRCNLEFAVEAIKNSLTNPQTFEDIRREMQNEIQRFNEITSSPHHVNSMAQNSNPSDLSHENQITLNSAGIISPTATHLTTQLQNSGQEF